MMGHPWDQKWKTGDDVGEGGQGVVQRVKWIDDESVTGVLKRLKNNKKESARARMRREVVNLGVLAKLGASVPRVIDDNTSEYENLKTELYMVMTHIPGVTLEKFVEMNGPLPIDQAIKFVLNLCRTIRIAHEQQILHRDLKPDNIIVRDPSTNDLVIVDYGLSFNVDDDAITGIDETFRNKFLDLPETNTFGGNRRDSCSDLTALMAILYYCLTKGIPGHLLDSRNLPPHKRPGFTIAEHHNADSRGPLLDEMFTRAFSVMSANRFQQLEEIETQLSVLLTPLETDLSDPLQLARKLSRQLTQGHRKTQLTSFIPEVNALWQNVNEQANKYKEFGQFRLTCTKIGIAQLLQATPPSLKLPEGLDLVPTEGRYLLLKAEEHNKGRHILMAVASSQERCVLLAYDGVEETPGQQSFFGPMVNLRWCSVKEVCWFQGSSKPIFPLVTIFIRQWLIKEMESLAAEMLETEPNGSQQGTE